MQHSHLLADLRDAAQEWCDFFADKRLHQRFMLGPEHPGHQRHQDKQRHGNEEFPLHAPPPNEMPAARMEGALITGRATPRMTRFIPAASAPRVTTLIVSTFVMNPRRSS